LTPLETSLNQKLQVRLGQLRGEKGSASPPRRRWKEMAGDHSTFKNAQYPVDTADIWYFHICRLVEIYVMARPFPNAMIVGSWSQAQASGPQA